MSTLQATGGWSELRIHPKQGRIGHLSEELPKS